MAEAVMIRGKKKTKPKVKEKLPLEINKDDNLDLLADICKNIDLNNLIDESNLPENHIKETPSLDEKFKDVANPQLQKLVDHDIKTEINILNIQQEETKISVNEEVLSVSFKNLNDKLHIMEPYLQPEVELKKIKDSCSFVNTSPSAPLLACDELGYVNASISSSTKHMRIIDSMAQRCCQDINVDLKPSYSQLIPLECLDIKPYSKIQLSALYNNLRLEERDNIISEFLNFEKNVSHHEFQEVILNYLRARTSLIGAEKEINSKENDYKKAKGKIWIFEERITTEEGMCEDDQLLTVSCTHEFAVYQPSMTEFILKQLKKIRESIFDSYTLHVYVAEMSKLQVENYLQKVTNTSYFVSLAKNTPVQCSFSECNGDEKMSIQNLRECISILFSFCRRNVKDSKFVRDIKTWLSELVAILLRVATWKDHLFILNHLMRCPSGVGEWGSLYLQVVPPLIEPGQQMFGSPYLDHLVTVLSIILLPVKEREAFLRHYKSFKSSEDDEESVKDSVWIVVDSSGEDEEDALEMWHYFKEDDIIQFLNQIPFEEMFKNILFIESSGEDCCYQIEKASHHSLIKLFAFCTCLLRLFEDGLKTYCNARYKGVVKRISRLIRHIVLYVTDHWQNYVRYQMEQNENLSSEDNAMFSRLQVEYDEFFENSVKTVFLSPRRGAWQFLAVIPYTCVSLLRLSKIAYKLHVGYKEEHSDEVENEDWPSILLNSDTRGRLQDQLLKMKDSEAYYLLTAFANMALVRATDEKEFINAIVINIFDAAFVNEGTREMLNRAGRDLFLILTNTHPFTISTILTELQEKLTLAGSLSIYLFRYISLEKWHPSEEDLQCLSYWLLYTPPSSLENQLTKIILANLNWGFNAQGTQLALPKEIHERIALLVVETGLKLSLKEGQGNLISEGVKQVTSVVYAPSPEQVLIKWCWSMLNQLHLHQLDQTLNEVQRLLSNPGHMLIGVGDFSTSPKLEILKKGVAAKDPLAIFGSMLISSWGHSLPEICNHCSECLEALVVSGFSEFALTVLHLITPFFFNQYEELTSDTKFMCALQSILSADQTYVNLAKSYIVSDQTGRTLRKFEDLIIEQLSNFKRYNLDNSSHIVTFWLHILTTIPNWRTNSSVLKLLDAICEFCLFDPPCWRNLKDHFREHKKIVSGEVSGKTGLGSLLNWVSLGVTTPRSLLIKSSAADTPWFGLAVLICEAQEENSSGLWKSLLKTFHSDPSATLDTAIKTVCTELEMDVIPSSSLAIYRLGQLILDLPVDHPSLPLTVQAYLNLHLSRTPPQTGQYDCNSVIFKFYEGYINANFVKRIKSKVAELSAFHEKELAQVKAYENENSEIEVERKLHEKEKKNERKSNSKLERLTELSATLNGMSTWLDETRLYETGLYLPALPPKLLPKKLLLVFQESWEFWIELIDTDFLKNSQAHHLRNWKKHRSHVSSLPSPPNSSSSSPAHCHSDSKSIHCKDLNPTESILKRLKEYDACKLPPSLPDFHQKKAAISISGTLNKDSVLYDIERYTGLIVQGALRMVLQSKEMCALDCAFAELVPQLWTNPTTKTVMNAKCEPKKNSKLKSCTGPANIVVEYCEKRLNEGINARIEQNREQRKFLYEISLHSPPLQLCEAAVHLEALVNLVVHWHKHYAMEGSEKEARSVVAYGRELFYHFVELTSEETNLYPPAKQLITTCADILGQEFLRNHADCQESLVIQVLQSSSLLGVLLSPHFTPVITPIQTYLNMYSSLTPHVGSQPDLCFMILSKFEMELWLRQKNVTCSERSQLVNTIGAALTALLSLGERNTIMCLELYRVHLRAMLSFKFHDHFIQILSVLLDLSQTTTVGCGDVGISIWYDLLNIISQGKYEFSPQMETAQELSAIKAYCQRQTLMSPQMIKDTLQLLSRHFIHFRLQYGLYGLYPKYKLFIKPITMLVAMISHSYIITANFISETQDSDLLIQKIWEMLEGVWAAWVAPLGGVAHQSLPLWIQELTRDTRILLPWSPGDCTGPAHAVAMYSGTIAFFHETFVGSNVLSLYLEYYAGTYAVPEVKDHILGVIHSHMSSLPWHHLCPTLKDVELISKIINEFLPECHSFIGHIFIQISWNKIIKRFSDSARERSCNSEISFSLKGEKNEPSASLVKLHILLLNILVRISMEPSVRQSGLLLPLLQIAESFQWKLVDAKNYESVINWFVMSCDPRIVLNMQNRNPIDVSIVRLLHVSGGYTRDSPNNPHRSGPLKRRLLVRALCRLVMTSATRHKILLTARKSLFSETFAILLAQMEDTIVEGVVKEHKFEEGLSLSSEAVGLIGGGASTPALQDVCRDSLLEWLKGSHPSIEFLLPLISSVSKGILQLHHRSPIMEGCLRAIFKHADVTNGPRLSWPTVVQVLSFPVSNPLHMLTFAAQENYLLLIFAHTRWRLLRASCSDQSYILSNLMELFTSVNPDESCEVGLLLVLGEILQLIINKLTSGPENGLDYNLVWKHCKTLSSCLSILGEDKASQGILAAIGLGKKSPLSVRMRLICKSLHTFLIGQLLSPGFFCSINEHSKSISEIDQSPINEDSCEESLRSLHHLMALRTSALYLENKLILEKAIVFNQDVSSSILDIRKFLNQLVQGLYPEEEALKFLYDDEVKFLSSNSSSLQSSRDSILYKPSLQSDSHRSKSFDSIPEFQNEAISAHSEGTFQTARSDLSLPLTHSDSAFDVPSSGGYVSNINIIEEIYDSKSPSAPPM